MTTQLVLESRSDSVMKGIKQGAIKAAVDKVVDMISDPISDAILKNLAPDHPAIHILRPATKAVLAFIVSMGIAESAAYFGPMVGKAIPSVGGDNLEEKSQLLAVWIRQYAGEKVGEQAIKGAIDIVPLIFSHFSGITNDDLKIAMDLDLTKDPEANDISPKRVEVVPERLEVE